MVRSVFEMISKMGFVQFECTMHNAHCTVAIEMLSEVSNIIENSSENECKYFSDNFKYRV